MLGYEWQRGRRWDKQGGCGILRGRERDRSARGGQRWWGRATGIERGARGGQIWYGIGRGRGRGR